jgi:hypothetical protein
VWYVDAANISLLFKLRSNRTSGNVVYALVQPRVVAGALTVEEIDQEGKACEVEWIGVVAILIFRSKCEPRYR